MAMSKSKDHERLIAAAHGIALQAAEHKERFTTAGFEEDFSDRLTKGADDLRVALVALDERNADLRRRPAASAGMHQELLRGRDQNPDARRHGDAAPARRLRATRRVGDALPIQYPDARKAGPPAHGRHLA